MSAIRKTAPKGFTLVEILIVVIILGILAAIVIPQFTNASQNARESSLQSTLQTLRGQIQLYKLQHGDALPDLTSNWNLLTTVTTYNGQNFGPYMQSPPVNPINTFGTVSDSSANLAGVGTIAALTGDIKTPGTGVGFLYDFEAGNGSGLIYGTDSTGKAVAGPSGSTTPF
jgi:general secretion pathway protein G